MACSQCCATGSAQSSLKGRASSHAASAGSTADLRKPNQVMQAQLHVTRLSQQGAGTTVQRSCRGAVPPAPPTCVPDPTIRPPPARFLFNVDCDDFAPGEQASMEAFVRRIPPGSTVRVVGFASADGPAAFNDRLSCSRATRGLAVVRANAAPTVLIRGVDATGGVPGTEHDANMRAVGLIVSRPPPPPIPPPTPVKPGPSTPCARGCELAFDRCLDRGASPLFCIAARATCQRGCAGAPGAFEVCARLLQPPVEVSGCNHAYVETPRQRYAIITPCTSQASFATPRGGVAIKTDISPDPCSRPPTCVTCRPKPGITDLEACFRAQFTAYAAPSVHKLFGPNSNTFAGTLARACCDNMTPKPAVFGCLPGWDDPPAAAAPGPCPTGPPVC